MASWVLRDPAPAAGLSSPKAGAIAPKGAQESRDVATEDGRLKYDKQPKVEPAGVDPALIPKAEAQLLWATLDNGRGS